MNKKILCFLLLSVLNFVPLAVSLNPGEKTGSQVKEGMGFHTHHAGYHRVGGYSSGRAYGAHGRHHGRYAHRGYGRHGSHGYWRGGKYWGYYSPHYQYGYYPWYYYGDPYFYYQKADYYPWYYGYNPGYLWW